MFTCVAIAAADQLQVTAAETGRYVSVSVGVIDLLISQYAG